MENQFLLDALVNIKLSLLQFSLYPNTCLLSDDDEKTVANGSQSAGFKTVLNVNFFVNM